MLTKSKALQIYIHDLTRRNYSTYTIKNYTFYIKKFNLYMATKTQSSLSSVTLDTILEYHKYLKNYRTKTGKKYKQTSIDHTLKALRQFFKFLKHQDLILLDPTEGIPPIHYGSPIPKSVMTREEVETLLNQPDQKTPSGFRDRAIMETLYSTGIRRNELINLTVYDIDMKAGLLRINKGKMKKDRVVPIGKIAIKYIKEYLLKVRPKLAKRKSMTELFVCHGSNPLNASHITRTIQNYVKKAGFKRSITCHSFRHTCATEMLKGGSSIRYVQEMLGHANIRTTQVYTRVIPIDLKKAHKKSHPRERMQNKRIIPFTCPDGKPVFYRTRKNRRKTPIT